ncbi:MAG: DNA-3-methyladenine glycosylase 2 family protein [Chloroflexi bacterium]|nr:DNA-3-methyladenine glycosylase 2 family protein [Chloroflexota bacterium]
MDRLITNLQPAPPFDLELTAAYHTYFRGRYGTDSWVDGRYRRLLDLGPKLVLASVRTVGTVEEPELEVELRGENLTQQDAAAGKAQVAWLLGTQQELTPFYDLARRDPALAAICERFHGLHLPHTSSVFEALILAILGQQISTSVARIVRTLLIETYGLRQAFDGDDYYAFPRPEALASASVEDLRQLKLSYRKAEYVQGIARAARDGTGGLDCLNEKSDEEVVQQVTQLRGVGKWTAQWVLVRGLGRPDALPLGDLALRRIVSSLYFDGEPITDEQLGPFSARWSPWRTYATIYLFTALRAGMV